MSIKISKVLKAKGQLYRSNRPKGLPDLKAIKEKEIYTVISLEEGWASLLGWPMEKELWSKYFGKFISLPMSNIFPPSLEACEVVNKHIVNAKSPLLVHCYSGVDRTGYVIAYHLAKNKILTPAQAWEYAVGTGQHFWFRWWRRSFMKMFMV